VPTIELTDEQAEELREVLAGEIAHLDSMLGHDIAIGLSTDPDFVEDKHRLFVLKDIMELLEIA